MKPRELKHRPSGFVPMANFAFSTSKTPQFNLRNEMLRYEEDAQATAASVLDRAQIITGIYGKSISSLEFLVANSDAKGNAYTLMCWYEHALATNISEMLSQEGAMERRFLNFSRITQSLRTILSDIWLTRAASISAAYQEELAALPFLDMVCRTPSWAQEMVLNPDTGIDMIIHPVSPIIPGSPNKSLAGPGHLWAATAKFDPSRIKWVETKLGEAPVSL